jgi:hypothetical protein
MSKTYHSILISFAGILGIGLTVSLTPPSLSAGPDLPWGISTAQASDSDSHTYGADGYDEEGYDHEGHDRGGYNREGYDKEGHDHGGYDKEGFKDDGRHRDGHYDSGRDRHGRHDKPKAAAPASGSEQPFKAKPTVKQY